MMSFDDTRTSMQHSLDHFKVEISAIRTGRAVPALIENIVCNAYGGAQKLTVKELGTITTMDSQSLVVQPWDASVIGEIRQGILAANVGLTPVIDNNLIRISVPALTTERRQEYVKLLHQKTEETRVSIRTIRQEKMKEIKSAFEGNPTSSRSGGTSLGAGPTSSRSGGTSLGAGKLSEDDKFRAEEDLQKITDEFVGKIDEISDKKEQEILSI